MDGTEGREEREAGEGFCLVCLGDLCVLLFDDLCCFEMLAEEFPQLFCRWRGSGDRKHRDAQGTEDFSPLIKALGKSTLELLWK